MRSKTAIIQDTRRQRNDGTYPVKLRVTYNREQKYYPTDYSLTAEDFEKAQGTKPRNSHKDVSLKLQACERKASVIIEALPLFTWQDFEKHYLGNKSVRALLADAFGDYIKELKEAGRIGTALSYECANGSLGRFVPGAKFTDITPDLLRKYEKWMLNKGNSITTVGIYLRSLRTLFNSAIAEGVITKEYYPFGKRRYEIPTGNNVKKALPIKDIGAIYYYNTLPGTTADMAKDYWYFMYLCNGINMKDMCLLKYENLKEDVLQFERAKTTRTKRNVEAIRVTLTEDMKVIINKWGNKVKEGRNYIFPVLAKGLLPERERQLIQQLTHVINDHMKVIAKELGITSNVTTYAARHSFATVMKRSGASTEFISEALGHSNLKTTQSYLAGFEDESKKEIIKALTAFKTAKADNI